MNMKAIPYLFFGGSCADAVSFYERELGADVKSMVRFGDVPGSSPEAAERVMHAEFQIGESTILASDGQAKRKEPVSGFAISLTVPGDAEAEHLFAVLSDQGRVDMPMMTTPFASRFGMTTDRFGTPWMVATPQPQCA